jgi:hypothetical protein
MKVLQEKDEASLARRFDAVVKLDFRSGVIWGAEGALAKKANL